MPLFVRILSHFTGHVKALPGPYTLGRYSILVNFIGLAFLIFTSITFNFPTLAPVDEENMNYTSAAIGVIGLISLVVSYKSHPSDTTATDENRHGSRLGERHLPGRRLTGRI